MTILSQLNSPAMYLICGGVIVVVALICVLFMVRAYRAGLAIGMDATKMRTRTPGPLAMSQFLMVA